MIFDVYKDLMRSGSPREIARAEENPKHRMAMLFRWYFKRASRLTLSGDRDGVVDYQVPCGPALGAFNHFVRGTPLENWRNRHVDEVGRMIMEKTAAYLSQRIAVLMHGNDRLNPGIRAAS